MNNKNVIIVSEHYGKWGAERSTCSLATYIKRLGNKVIVIIPHHGEITEMLDAGQVEYYVHFFKGWIYYNKKNYFKWFVIRLVNWIQLYRLRSILTANGIQPDIVYSNTLVHGFGIALANSYGVPHIQHIRENVDIFKMHFYKGYAQTLHYIEENSEKLICTCKSIRDRYSCDINDCKLTYVYNGVPICDYKAKTVPNEKCLRLLYVGRLDEDKRPQDILEAIYKLIDNGSTNLLLDMYGEGGLKNELQAFIQKHEMECFVHLKGFSNTISYDDYDVGIIASTFEAFARTTLEYMMHGLAVVGSNSGGTCEQVVDNETGLLFETHNPEDLAKKIQYFYEHRDSCLIMGLRGRKRVETIFTQDNYVKGVVHIFDEILDHRF